MSSDVEVRHNVDANRFEAHVEHGLAGVLDYRITLLDGSPVYEMFHTRTMQEYGGRGVASAMAEFALDYVQREGGWVIPSCWFVSEYIDKHPVYADLLPD